jgi:hypothetical protein
MANALKHPQPEVSFAQVGYDTITALTQLAAIFKNKFQKPTAPELIQASLKAAENKQPAALAQPILTSPMQHNYQTRSHIPITANTESNTPLLIRVVTPMMGWTASPRVPARTQNLSPEICHKTISGTRKPPTSQLHWEPIIGHTNIFPTQ